MNHQNLIQLGISSDMTIFKILSLLLLFILLLLLLIFFPLASTADPVNKLSECEVLISPEDINWNKQDIPKLAKVNGPVLLDVINSKWPKLDPKSVLFGQATKESCITLTHKRCWNPRVEFKTNREWGIGIPQLTITKKFDNFRAARKLDPELSRWMLSDRFNVRKQLIALTMMNKNLYMSSRKLSTIEDVAIHFMLSSYNGGMGGLMQDRVLCRNKKGCNSKVWFSNVERYSFKSRIKIKGYGKSFYDINRGYVKSIWFERQLMFNFVNCTLP
jgi:hypothetical protein